MEGFLWFLLLTQAVIFGAFSSFVASEKGRDSQTWFVNGFLFSLVALLAVCGVPSVKSSEAKAEHVEKKTEEELDLTFD